MADAYVALATRRCLDPCEARGDWSAACDMFQGSHVVWQDMRRRRILNVIDAAKPDKLADALGRCRAMLGGAAQVGNGGS